MSTVVDIRDANREIQELRKRVASLEAIVTELCRAAKTLDERTKIKPVAMPIPGPGISREPG